MKVKTNFQEYKPPETKNQHKLNHLLGELKRTERYQKAISCKYCQNYGDSFNNYHCTRCWLKQETLASLNVDRLGQCFNCEQYERKE